MRERLEVDDEDVTYDKIAKEMNVAVSEVAYGYKYYSSIFID